MVNMETITVVDIVVVAAAAEAVAMDVDMEEDVVDETQTSPLLKIITVSPPSSLP